MDNYKYDRNNLPVGTIMAVNVYNPLIIDMDETTARRPTICRQHAASISN